MTDNADVYEVACNRMRARFVSIRAEAQSLLGALDRIDAAGKLLDPGTRRSQIKHDFDDAVTVFKQRDLREHASELKTAWKDALSVPAQGHSLSFAVQIADEVEKVTNDVEELNRYWPSADSQCPWPSHVDCVLAQSTAAREILDSIVSVSARRTILDRLRAHLLGRSTGRALDFHATFRDEQPDDARRQKLLEEINQLEGRSFNGVVDVKKGLVYATSPSKFRRDLSMTAPLITAIGLALVLFLASLIPIVWPLMDRSKLLVGFLLVLIGMVSHLVVENAKVLDMNGEILVVRDKLTWLHLHWVGISWSLVPAVVTVVGLRFLKFSPSTDFLTFVFAGYSVDSISGLFLTRYDASAKKGVKA